MELNGNIVGVITDNLKNENYGDFKISEIVKYRIDDSLKMVNLDNTFKDKYFKDLSSLEKNKVLLASKLNERTLELYDFSKGMTKKEVDFFKRLLKKISSYNKKILLYGKDMNLYLNLVDNLYVINNEDVIYHTTDIFDEKLYEYVDKPEIIDFITKCKTIGISLDHYKDINELIKAIYRIKS